MPSAAFVRLARSIRRSSHSSISRLNSRGFVLWRNLLEAAATRGGTGIGREDLRPTPEEVRVAEVDTQEKGLRQG